MKHYGYDPTLQLALLLPTQFEIAQMEPLGEIEWLDSCGNIHFQRWFAAVCRIINNINASPRDPELWIEISCAFGSIGELAWKYAYVAHRLDPDNYEIIKTLEGIEARVSDRVLTYSSNG